MITSVADDHLVQNEIVVQDDTKSGIYFKLVHEFTKNKVLYLITMIKAMILRYKLNPARLIIFIVSHKEIGQAALVYIL